MEHSDLLLKYLDADQIPPPGESFAETVWKELERLKAARDRLDEVRREIRAQGKAVERQHLLLCGQIQALEGYLGSGKELA